MCYAIITYIIEQITYVVIMKLLGTSKIAIQNKVTIIEQVAGALNIKIGDRLAFLKNNSGDIVIKRLEDVILKETEG